MGTADSYFPDRIRLLLDACPGPPMLRRALRVAALQAVAGVPGLKSTEGNTEAGASSLEVQSSSGGFQGGGSRKASDTFPRVPKSQGG